MHNPLAEQTSNETAEPTASRNCLRSLSHEIRAWSSDLDWVARVQANTSAIERRCAYIAGPPLCQKRTSSCLVAESGQLH